MKPQFHITIGNQAPIVIDLNDDEGIEVIIDWHPFRKKQGLPDALARISGLRWRNGKHYHLGWKTQDITHVASIGVAHVISDLEPTAPEKEELYVRPEPSCCFCYRKASEVKILIQQGEILFKGICDDCVDECHGLVQDRRSELAQSALAGTPASDVTQPD